MDSIFDIQKRTILNARKTGHFYLRRRSSLLAQILQARRPTLVVLTMKHHTINEGTKSVVNQTKSDQQKLLGERYFIVIYIDAI
jgi:hypothetical protein